MTDPSGALPRSVRIGYGSGSVATGAFGTVPGLMLRPSTRRPLSDKDSDGLLAASGLVGASADGSLELPSRMAPVNAMLDLASTAMREALPVAFLDRLSRPSAALAS